MKLENQLIIQKKAKILWGCFSNYCFFYFLGYLIDFQENKILKNLNLITDQV